MENIPKHIAIILDGNRRFAKKLLLKPWKGHEFGAKKVEQLMEWCGELGIKELTLYCFSVYNFNRAEKEVNFLMRLFEKEFKRIKNDERIYKNKIKINFIGRIWMLPKEIQKEIKELMELTKNHDNLKVNFALAYSGKTEIVDATKKIAKQIKEGKLDVNEIDIDSFGKNLYFNNSVDLIIRTSGEIRTSDFLPWQGANAEWIFIKKYWPEIEKGDFIKCIEEYSKRERRIGK